MTARRRNAPTAAALAAAMLILSGCGTKPAPAAEQWLGKWTGPEGTFLQIARVEGKYTVTIMNLDAARTFPAAADAGGLSFERDGRTESIRPTDGAGTGMKWLAGKSSCLVVRPGEGFCRD